MKIIISFELQYSSASTMIFSRTLIIPFKEVEVNDWLINRRKQKDKLEERIANSKSCGIILGLFKNFNGILDDPSATDIQKMLPNDMDLKSQENYFFLLYTVGNVQLHCLYPSCPSQLKKLNDCYVPPILLNYAILSLPKRYILKLSHMNCSPKYNIDMLVLQISMKCKVL